MKTALEAIHNRRSIRRFTSQPVDEKTVEELLRAAMCAPSARNVRPWHFVVLRDPGVREAVTRFHPYARMLPQAQLGIAVCGARGEGEMADYWVQDCSAAMENLLLAAEALGLGAVWLGVTPRPERIEGLSDLLGLPEGIQPLGIAAIGYPAETKETGDRMDPARVHWDRW